MTQRDFHMEDMKKRYAKFSEMKLSKQAFVDTRLPEHERDLYNVIGNGVSEDPELKPSINTVEGFNIHYVGAEPGKGAALHTHTTVEVFFAMSGKWSVYWGENGENNIELDTFDIISVPKGVMRGFKNIGDSYANLMAILGGNDPGKIGWAKSVLDLAEKSGLRLDSSGKIVELNST
tara:strand:- start:7793 stop:8323 length:531 start_codon:yes stop_codon:yes gene_type:complete